MIKLSQVAKDICSPSMATLRNTKPYVKFILAAPTKRSRARPVGGVITWVTWSGVQIGATFERMIALQADTEQGLEVSWPHHSSKGQWSAHDALNGFLRPAPLKLQEGGLGELQGVDVATATLRSFRRGGITHALDCAEPGNEYLIECHRRKAARRGKAANLPIHHEIRSATRPRAAAHHSAHVLGRGEEGRPTTKRRRQGEEERGKGRRKKREGGGGLRGGEDHHAELDCTTARLLEARRARAHNCSGEPCRGGRHTPSELTGSVPPPLLGWG
jgi:hypothetical protein